MKNGETVKSLFNMVQTANANPKPTAPFAGQQLFNGHQRPDPSSAVRSDRYPIPAFAEHHMRGSV